MKGSNMFRNMALLSALGLPLPALAQVQDLDEIPQRFYSYYNKGDAAGIASLYAEDATLYPNTGTELIIGRQGIKEYFRNIFDSANSYRLEPLEGYWQQYEYFAVRSSTANVYMELKDGKKIGIPLRATYVYQRGPQGWLIVHQQATRLSPLSADK
jgi:ketosteroid isomerase-like protein